MTAEDIFGRGAAEKIAFPERLRCFPGTRRITFVEVLNRLPLNGLFRLPMPWPPLWAQRPSFRPIRWLPEIFNITAVLRPCVEGMHGPLTDFCGTVSADLRAGSLVWLRISKGLEGWFLVMSMTDLEIEEAASTRQAAPVVRWPARVKPHARGHRDPGVRTPLRKPARNGQSPGEADRPLGNLMTGRDEVQC